MDRMRNHKTRPQGQAGDISGGKFEYDRADEKRKIHEEIEAFLLERQKKDAPEK